ncbi:MAG: alpha-galactosidase [Blautia sp.]|nr:alpha-galactosidase [Blautia sp.]
METLEVKEGKLDLIFEFEQGKEARLLSLHEDKYGRQSETSGKYLRIVEILCPNQVNYSYHGQKNFYDNPQISLFYESYELIKNEHGQCLKIYQKSKEMRVTTVYQFFQNMSVFRCYSKVDNIGKTPILIDGISSFSYGNIISSAETKHDMGKDLTIAFARNTWSEECRWELHNLYDCGIRSDKNLCYDRMVISNHSGFSSGEYLPVAALYNHLSNYSIMWQIEHNGAWSWEIGNTMDDYWDSYLHYEYTQHVYLQLYGPRLEEAHWSKQIMPGKSFTTVPVAVCVEEGKIENAMKQMNAYRRNLCRKTNSYVIFNDYMNCMMGNATEDKLEPYIVCASELGCEVFVIDCGWYDNGNWQFTFGKFEESISRYPSGLAMTMQKIRDAGMIPGIWLELESFGVDGDNAGDLPGDWAFVRNGRNVVDSGRIPLDFRNSAVRENASRIIKRVITEYGVGYIKIDYNFCTGLGTDYKSDSLGDGLLEHNRAYLRWLEETIQQYPDVIWENCASGGLRMDYALLSRMDLQSLSDQEDYRKTSAIASNCATAVTPEYAGIWNYPIRDDKKEVIVNMVNSMLFRTILGGKIIDLSRENKNLLKEGILLQKEIRKDIAESVPIWPCGFNIWDSEWYVYGAKCRENIYLAIWRNTSSNNTHLICLDEKIGKAELFYPQCMKDQIQVTIISDQKIYCHISEENIAVILKVSVVS